MVEVVVSSDGSSIGTGRSGVSSSDGISSM